MKILILKDLYNYSNQSNNIMTLYLSEAIMFVLVQVFNFLLFFKPLNISLFTNAIRKVYCINIFSYFYSYLNKINVCNNQSLR